MGGRNSKPSRNLAAIDIFAELAESCENKSTTGTGSTVISESDPPNPYDEYTFNSLETKVFTVGTDCVMENDDGTMVSGRVSEAHVTKGGLGGKTLLITMVVIRTNGKVFFRGRISAGIPAFSGKRMLSELGVRPILPNEKEKLKERGRLFAKHGLGNHFMAYSDKMIVNGQMGPTQISAEGRVMVDTASFLHFNPSNDLSLSHRRRIDQTEDSKVYLDYGRVSSTEIPESTLHLCYPTVYGFSFKAKCWGEIKVADLNEIEFCDNAFDALVLERESKTMVETLVKNVQGDDSFTDIIQGKGGGHIFLLHGPPGTGKTLTAEAVSELLHRPLYCIDVGELGITPEALESRLRRILELTERWNAVLLIDECDIFLARRDINNVLRNAMVGIFLRLLEYYHGVLFLTSNRADGIDEAFQSRIGISLKYSSLDLKSRKQVWLNLFDAAGVTGITNVDELAKHELNGRQIKTAIRLAASFAKTTNDPVCVNHVLQAISCADLKQQHSMFI